MPHPLRHTSVVPVVIDPFSLHKQAKQQGARQPTEVEGQPPPPRMCLPIDCWLCCMSRTVDDDPAPASRTRNGAAGHYTSNGNGTRPHGHAPAAAAQEKIVVVAAYPYAGADETLKQQQQQLPAAWNGRVAAADGHGARGYERAHLPAHREDAADSHYTAAATADHERY